MKKIILITVVFTLIIVSCTQNNKKDQANNASLNSVSQKYSCPMHAEIVGNKDDKCSICGMNLTEPVMYHSEENNSMEGMNHTVSNSPIQPIIDKYIALKNALVNDDSEKTALIGNEFILIFDTVKIDEFDDQQKNSFKLISKKLKEQAEFIAKKGNDIEIQRQHFEMMSTDIITLVEAFGASQKLYQDFCPMYNNNKGGTWLSESKEIKNPYFGAKMLKCGTIKKEF